MLMLWLKAIVESRKSLNLLREFFASFHVLNSNPEGDSLPVPIKWNHKLHFKLI